MEGVEASGEDESHHNNPDNIYVELNNQPSELLQTVKDLKAELQTVKEDNERILRSQEELNLKKLLVNYITKERIKGKNMKLNLERYHTNVKVRS